MEYDSTMNRKKLLIHTPLMKVKCIFLSEGTRLKGYLMHDTHSYDIVERQSYRDGKQTNGC